MAAVAESFDCNDHLWTKKHAGKIQRVLIALGQYPISIRGTYEDSRDKEHNKFFEPAYRVLHLTVDFDKVNSLSLLKSHVNEVLEHTFKSFLKAKEKRGANKTQAYQIDYDLIWRIGTLKEEEGLSNAEIAKMVYPGDADPDSARIKVVNHWHQYRDLVNGGFMALTTP